MAHEADFNAAVPGNGSNGFLLFGEWMAAYVLAAVLLKRIQGEHTL
jgi:hypothetical protein